MKSLETKDTGQYVKNEKPDHFEYATRIIDSWSHWKQELACGKSVNSNGDAVVDCKRINKQPKI